MGRNNGSWVSEFPYFVGSLINMNQSTVTEWNKRRTWSVGGAIVAK